MSAGLCKEEIREEGGWGERERQTEGGREGGRQEVGEKGKETVKLDIPVSHICNRTTVSVSLSTTRLVIKLAPTVEVICEGLKAPLQ